MKKFLALVAVVGVVAGCESGPQGRTDSANVDNNKKVYMAFVDEIMNKHNCDAVEKFLTRDFVEHDPFPGQEPGSDGFKKACTEFFKAFPDAKLEVKLLVAEGDKVCSYYTMTGTQKEDWMMLKNMGNGFCANGVDVVLIKGGKIAEHWGPFDALTATMQLEGKMPVEKK